MSCALTPSQSFAFSWTDSSSVIHSESYPGLLGLASSWASSALSTTGQQWVSACLASRVNWYGVHVDISSRGNHTSLGTTHAERTTDYPVIEGAFFGNLFTSYRYRTVDAAFRLDGELLRADVRPGVGVTADLSQMPAPRPAGSPCGSLKEARRFAGPLPYTFHHEPQTGRLLSVRGRRSTWDPQPVAVEVRELDFVSAGRFGAEPVLANAFYVSDIDYRWERGRLLTTERG